MGEGAVEHFHEQPVPGADRLEEIELPVTGKAATDARNHMQQTLCQALAGLPIARTCQISQVPLLIPGQFTNVSEFAAVLLLGGEQVGGIVIVGRTHYEERMLG
jgi:hypothetical protein